MLQLISVGIGGFIGAYARFVLTKMLAHYTLLPFGTLFSNIIAGLITGIIIGAERQDAELSPNIKLFMTTGFLGGLSTFSTFSLETVLFLEKGDYLKAGTNTLLNVIMSFIAVFAGFLIMKFVK